MSIAEMTVMKPRPWQEIILDVAIEINPTKDAKLRDELETSLDVRDDLPGLSVDQLRERADEAMRQRSAVFRCRV